MPAAPRGPKAADHYGPEKLAHYMTELVDYAERMTRAAIRELPDGVYDFLDHIDDDGIVFEINFVPAAVGAAKDGEHVVSPYWQLNANQLSSGNDAKSFDSGRGSAHFCCEGSY